MSDLRNENRFGIVVIKSTTCILCLKSLDVIEACKRPIKQIQEVRRSVMRLLRASEASMHFNYKNKLIDFVTTIPNLFSFFKSDNRFRSYARFCKA
jgi:hypothetical protein